MIDERARTAVRLLDEQIQLLAVPDPSTVRRRLARRRARALCLSVVTIVGSLAAGSALAVSGQQARTSGPTATAVPAAPTIPAAPVPAPAAGEGDVGGLERQRLEVTVTAVRAPDGVPAVEVTLPPEVPEGFSLLVLTVDGRAVSRTRTFVPHSRWGTVLRGRSGTVEVQVTALDGGGRVIAKSDTIDVDLHSD